MQKKTKYILGACAGVAVAAAITGGLLYSQYATQRASLLDIHDEAALTAYLTEISDQENVQILVTEEAGGFCGLVFSGEVPGDDDSHKTTSIILEEADAPFTGLYYPASGKSSISPDIDGRYETFPDREVTVCMVYGQQPPEDAAWYTFERDGTWIAQPLEQGEFLDLFLLYGTEQRAKGSLSGMLLNEDGEEIGLF